jgi:hypothetical protein
LLSKTIRDMTKKEKTTRTIDIFRDDYIYLDTIRITNMGKVSFANSIRELCRVHQLALVNGLIESNFIEKITKDHPRTEDAS